MKLRNYIVYILRSDNDYDRKVFDGRRLHARKLYRFNFLHRGHKYQFDAERSFIVVDPYLLRTYLLPWRFRRYDRLMLFKEPDDPLHGVELPVPSLTAPIHMPGVEESPRVFKAVVLSKLLHRYRSKQRFGFFPLRLDWKTALILIIALVALYLLLSGKLSGPGGMFRW